MARLLTAVPGPLSLGFLGLGAAGLLSAAALVPRSPDGPRAVPLGAASIARDGFDRIALPFLKAHCVRCHGAEVEQGDTRLDAVTRDGIAENPDDWEWLLERVEFEEMPPAGEAAPTARERKAFVKWLRTELKLGGKSDDTLPAVPLRRLTRAEWRHAVRDLFGVSFEPERYLPEDTVAHGFDHVAESQSLSEADFVRYLGAAEVIADRAVPVTPDGGPRVVRVEARDMIATRVTDDAAWLVTNGRVNGPVSIPSGGEYIMRAEVFGGQAGDEPVRVRFALGDGQPGEPMDAPGTANAPTIIEGKVHTPEGGEVRAGVDFLNDFYNKEKRLDRNLAVRWIEVEGPLGEIEPSGFLKEFLERVDAAGKGTRGLKAALGDWLRLAWRQDKVTGRDVDALLKLSSPKEQIEVRIRAAVTGALVSPRFLFKEERGGRKGSDGTLALRPREVATRLAGFLWNSVPDEALMDAASGGAFRKVAGVRKTAEGMLDDPRSMAFIDNFGEQWLQLRPLRSKRADKKTFNDFNGSMRDSMREETRRVLRDSLAEQRSLWDLVDGTMTIIDGRMANHYGVERTGQGRWQRVSLAETERRGLLGHASVLFLNSEPTRTSPVKRGKWVLDVLLGSAPPPPPPGADNFPKPKDGEAELPLRERMEAHRADPICASCHARMDPIGFGLDGFDAIGRERKDSKLNLHGVLPDGRSFMGAAELSAILREEDRFLEATVERLLTYALGRGLTRADRPTVQAILEELDSEHPTFRQAILAVVQTPAFLRIPTPKRN